jgi:hypothetical protein
MVDVVDVLDTFEAKRKRATKPIFEVERWAIGGGLASPKENGPSCIHLIRIGNAPLDFATHIRRDCYGGAAVFVFWYCDGVQRFELY